MLTELAERGRRLTVIRIMSIQPKVAGKVIATHNDVRAQIQDELKPMGTPKEEWLAS